jgi:hypothetical protein
MMRLAARLRRFMADFCYVVLTAALLAGSTLLASLGIIFGLAVLAAGGDGLVLFSHLENLSRHYLQAGAGARAAFDRDAIGLLSALFTLIVLARLPLWIARVRSGLEGGSRHG